MILKVLVHRAEEGGYWSEVPALPGCFSQADSLNELRVRTQESIDAYLGVDEIQSPPENGEIWEIAV